MSEQNEQRPKDQPRGHVFDGIFEYDNDLPGWWVALFIVTLIFSVLYLGWYHLGIFPSKSLEAEYAQERAAAARVATLAAAAAQPVDVAAVTGDQDAMAAAERTFKSTCGPCHGPAGGGLVGPNLTDDFWIYGATPAAVETMIAKGVPEKGMPGWQDILGRDRVRHLVGYIVSIQGTNPTDAKAPQGEAGKLK